MTPIQKALIVLIVNYIKHLKQTQQMEKKIKIENKTAMTREENATKLVEVEDLPGTPFKAIKQNDNWFITWGPYKLSPNLNFYEDCVNYLEDKKWHIHAVYTVAILEAYTADKLNSQPMSVHENADIGAF